MDETIVNLEHDFWSAAGQPDFYREHFAEDGVCVFTFGVLDKAATVSSMQRAEPWSTFELLDLTVVPLNEDAIALVYAASAERAGELYRASVSSVYTRRDGRWQLTVHHQTPRT